MRVALAAIIALLIILWPLGFSSEGRPSEGIPGGPSEGSSGGIHFADTAQQAGIRAQMVCGGPEKKWIPEANGSGAAWLDYDRDGWIDLLIVNGSSMERLRKVVSGKTPPPAKHGVYLYRNLGEGRFEDVTARSGLANPYWGTGANAADYNNDGDPDILITTIGLDLLFRNNGDGTFTEVGKAAGLSRAVAWHTGSAFGDYDDDGHLDLYVVGYVDIAALLEADSPPVCRWKGLPVFCGPMGLKGERDILYHNNGDGTFTDVTRQVGVEDSGAFQGFTAVFEDFNQDGRLDIFVANDSVPNYLYLNQGNGTFRESALAAGVAVDGDGASQADMGVAVGDYDRDGKVDLLTTTFEDGYFPLFKQGPAGFFLDVSYRVGLTIPTTPLLGWGCGFSDLDNDGDKDLWLASGHIYPGIERVSHTSYSQPFLVFENRADKFVQVFSFPSKLEHSLRGASAGDFDNDGKTDIVLLPVSGSPILLENRTGGGSSWIGFTLKGRQSNGEAIGARIRLEACGQIQYDSVRNGTGYLSRDDPRPRFGLGGCTKISKVVVTWPRGQVQVLTDLPVNRYTSLEEPH